MCRRMNKMPGNIESTMSLKISNTLMPICAACWSMQTSLPVGPITHGLGVHCEGNTHIAATAHAVAAPHVLHSTHVKRFWI